MIDRIKVLVVDDSAYNRRTIIKMLEDIAGIEVVGYACDGEEALRKVFDLKPDLVTLDLEMPKMDGFTFLRLIMQNRPTPVLVVSARSEGENVFKALELGAVDFVAKPTAKISPELFNMREDLVSKVKGIVRADMKKVLQRGQGAHFVREEQIASQASRLSGSSISYVLIGSSTGGPPALQTILSGFTRRLNVGIAISQHMPPGFTRAFADRLDKFSPMDISEARPGDLLTPGRVLIAPGGKNLVFHSRGSDLVAEIVDPLPEQRYVPSVDTMFNSAAELVGPKMLAVVLTGMGNDGAKGVTKVKMHGGQVLAESEESSVVFGMPKEAIATGCVDRILPLPLLGNEILHRCGYRLP